MEPVIVIVAVAAPPFSSQAPAQVPGVSCFGFLYRGGENRRRAGGAEVEEEAG